MLSDSLVSGPIIILSFPSDSSTSLLVVLSGDLGEIVHPVTVFPSEGVGVGVGVGGVGDGWSFCFVSANFCLQ